MAGATKPTNGGMGWIVAIGLGMIVIGQCSLKDASTENEDPTRVHAQKYVHARALNCRVTASASATVIRSLVRNDLVEVMDEQKGWAHISGEPQCWVSAAFLGERLMTEPEAPAASAQGFISSSSRSGGDIVSSEHRQRRNSAAFGTHYANCSAARAAGAAPVYANDPGYSRRLDRDNDGVGCE